MRLPIFSPDKPTCFHFVNTKYPSSETDRSDLDDVVARVINKLTLFRTCSITVRMRAVSLVNNEKPFLNDSKRMDQNQIT